MDTNTETTPRTGEEEQLDGRTPQVAPTGVTGEQLGADIPESPEELKRLVSKLLKGKQTANLEAQQLRERLEGYQKAEEQVRQSTLTEAQKLQERADKLEQENRALRVQNIRAQAASKFALGDLAEFLTGDDEETVTKQAEKLAAKLKQPPNLTAGATAQRAGGNPVGESYAQRLQRITGGGGGEIWDNPQAYGGGVFWPGQPDAIKE